jgi:hypothetical protein
LLREEREREREEERGRESGKIERTTDSKMIEIYVNGFSISAAL